MKLRTDINIKIGDIELRHIPEKYKGEKFIDISECDTDAHYYLYEIVKWTKDDDNKEYCYVIAFVDFIGYKHDEEAEIVSVGSRPWNLNKQDFDVYNHICRQIFTTLKDLFIYKKDDSDNY